MYYQLVVDRGNGSPSCSYSINDDDDDDDDGGGDDDDDDDDKH